MLTAGRIFVRSFLRPLTGLDLNEKLFDNVDGGRRTLAKGAKKQKKPAPTKKKKTQKTKKPAPLPKHVDPKIESKMDLCLELLKPTEDEPSPIPKKEQDEAAARAKEFSRRKMRQHRQWQADMSAKEWLTRAAILSLPLHLRVEAVKEDTTPIPMRLPFPTDTPPHEWT